MVDDGVGSLAVAAGVALLIVGAALVAGFVAADGPPERSDATVEKDYFAGEDLAEVDLAERSGRIELADGPSRTVLVSTDSSPSTLEPVVRALVRNGHEVRVHAPAGGATGSLPPELASQVQAAPSAAGSGEEVALATRLDDVDALLVVGGSQFQRNAHGTIANFSDAGGRLVVAADPMALGSGGSVDALTARFGVTVGDGYLYNMHENDANYQRVFATGGGSAIVDSVDRVVVDGAAPVWSDSGTALVSAGENTRYSTTRESGGYAVAVRNENAVVVGDTDVLQPLNYNRVHNNRFVGGVLGFLTDGPQDPYSPPTPEERPVAPGTRPPGEQPTGDGPQTPGEPPATATPTQPPADAASGT